MTEKPIKDPAKEKEIVRKMLEFFVIYHAIELEQGHKDRADLFMALGRSLEILFPEYLDNYTYERAMEEVEKIKDPKEREATRAIVKAGKERYDAQIAQQQRPKGPLN